MKRSTLPRTSSPRSTPACPTARPRRPGDTLSLRRPVPLGAVLVALVVVGVGGWSLGRPSQLDREAARLEQFTADRDVEQVAGLVTLVGELRADVVGPLEDLHAALPADGPAPPVQAETAATWEANFAEAVAPFEDPPSGVTGTNVARSTLRGSLEALHGSARTYRIALATDAATRDELMAEAATQRDLGIDLGGPGIMQLDERSHATGGTHHHGLVLPRYGRDEASGPFGPPTG